MRMLVAGEWCDASDGATIAVLQPGHRRPHRPASRMPPTRTSTEPWRPRRTAGAPCSCMPAHARGAVLIEAADRLDAEREALARLLAEENGKPIRQTRGEVDAAVRILRGFGEEAKRLFGRQVPMDAVPGAERHVAMVIRQPIGVVAAIVPFNYPVELYAHKVGAALGAGNAVIGKPPSDCPLTLLRLAAILEECGLPPRRHQMLTGSGARIGPRLAASPGVQMVTLTGSVETGVQLGTIAAEHMKPFHAELGGNDASIVCADADLELAARAILLGRLARGNGQICCSVKRVLVDRQRGGRRSRASWPSRPRSSWSPTSCARTATSARSSARRRPPRSWSAWRRPCAPAPPSSPGARGTAPSWRPRSWPTCPSTSGSSARRPSGRSCRSWPSTRIDEAIEHGQRLALRPAGRRLHPGPRRRP